MIQAKELRVGNYVRAINNDTLIVTSIENIGCIRGNVIEAYDDIEYGYHIDQLTGIPLTEEWLAKAGFELKINNNEKIIYQLKAHPLIRYVWQINTGWWFQFVNTHIECNFVHSLQNLVFSLTSNELFI